MTLDEAIRREKDPAVQVVGKLLQEFTRQHPKYGEMIEQDLENPEMSLGKAFTALKNYAKKHTSGNCWACPVFEITPDNEAVQVILDFYKIPNDWGIEEQTEPERKDDGVIDLLDLL